MVFLFFEYLNKFSEKKKKAENKNEYFQSFLQKKQACKFTEHQ